MSQAGKIALIGAGHMGGALAAGWLRNKRTGIKAEDILIVDPSPSEAVEALIEDHGLEHIDRLSLTTSTQIGTLVLAVKPQVLDSLAESLAPLLAKETAILSIMAGITIKRLENVFGDHPIVRAMPNTPTAVGSGISICVSNPAGEHFEDQATKLLKVGGDVEWVRDERLLGAVTAVSGSGPAYIFLLAEALAGAGFAEGLPRELADKLARQTIVGAGALLAASDKSPQDLRRAVTSPNGTTQAALDVLMGSGGGLPELVRMAVNAAERRSRALGAEPENR